MHSYNFKKHISLDHWLQGKNTSFICKQNCWPSTAWLRRTHWSPPPRPSSSLSSSTTHHDQHGAPGLSYSVTLHRWVGLRLGPAQIHQHSHRSQLTCQRLYSFQGRQTKDTGLCLFLTVTLAESTVTNTETAWAAIRTTYFLLHQWPRMRGILIRYWPSSLSSY